MLRLPARNFWLPAGAVVAFGVWPADWFGAGFGRTPGLSLPGFGVAVGFGAVTPGTAGTVGTGSCGVAWGVGMAITPLSMICEIVPVMPGIEICETGVPGGTSTVRVMRSPVMRTTVTECNSALAGSAATPRPTVAAITAMIPFRLFIFEYASPRALLRIDYERFHAAGATLPRGPGTIVTLLSGLCTCN